MERLTVEQKAGPGSQGCVGWQRCGRLGGELSRSWSTGMVRPLTGASNNNLAV